MNNLVLCGFMGCGKTTVGRLLAARTGRRFVDTDALIEEEAGMAVEDIFKRFGEEDFRLRERQACSRLAEKENLVIATGGGALTFPENAAVLRRSGVIILLDVSPETVLDRLKGDRTRPLLQREDKEMSVRELMARRLPQYYEAASLFIDGNQAPEAVAGDILLALGNEQGIPDRPLPKKV